MHPDAHDLGSAIRLGVSLLALAFVWQRVLYPTLVEMFRQSVFERRRELFLYMAGGHVAPTDPAYVCLRSIMNSMLRTAERFTFTRLLLALVVTNVIPSRSKLQEALDRTTDEAVRKRLEQLRDACMSDAISHSVRTSPLGILFLLFVLMRDASRPAEPTILRAIPRHNVIAEAEAFCDDDDGPWSLPPPPFSHTHATA